MELHTSANGRIDQVQFRWGCLYWVLVFVALSIGTLICSILLGLGADAVGFGHLIFSALFVILMIVFYVILLVFLLPSLFCLISKRLKDLAISPLQFFIWFVFPLFFAAASVLFTIFVFFSSIFFFSMCFFVTGTEGKNKFGSPPN